MEYFKKVLIAFVIILIDSVTKKWEKLLSTGVFRRMHKHCQRKKLCRFINSSLEISSDDNDESDKESSNQSNKE